MDLIIPVDDRTQARETHYYVTWEDVPDGWAVLVMPDLSLYVPGRHTTVFTDIPQSFPLGGDHINRDTQFDFIAHKPRGRVDAFDTLASARRYIRRQVRKTKQAEGTTS